MKLCKTQIGFSLVTSIFLLVVLASIGAFMITIGGTQRTTSVAAIQGARAFQAARSGIEWGIKRVIDDPGCAMITANPAFTFAVDGLNQFNVNVTCGVTTHWEDADPLAIPIPDPPNVFVYTITSVATYGTYGDQEYIRRQLTATVSPP